MRFKLSLLIISISLLSMNLYSRALRHINMNDVKQKHHQKLIEKKIQEKVNKQEKEFIASVMEQKKCDWRKELNEQMTTSDIFYTTLPAVGDIDLASGSWGSLSSVNGASLGGSTLTLSGDPTPYEYNSAESIISGGDYYDTLVIDVDSGGTTFYIDSSVPPYTNLVTSSSSGRYTISVPNGSKGLIFSSSGSGTVRFTPTWQRRSPKNVFVPLDSPEATSFVRTGSGDLSPAEKQKRLKEMLEASDEYVMNILGPDFPGSGAVPPGEAGDTPGVEIAQVQPIEPAQQRRGATGVGVPDTKELPGPRPAIPGKMNYPPEWTQWKNA